MAYRWLVYACTGQILRPFTIRPDGSLALYNVRSLNLHSQPWDLSEPKFDLHRGLHQFLFFFLFHP